MRCRVWSYASTSYDLLTGFYFLQFTTIWTWLWIISEVKMQWLERWKTSQWSTIGRHVSAVAAASRRNFIHTFSRSKISCEQNRYKFILTKCNGVKNTTLNISSCPSWLFKKSGGYFTLLKGCHSRTDWNITQKDANFNLNERKTTRKRVVPHIALQRVLFTLLHLEIYIYLVWGITFYLLGMSLFLRELSCYCTTGWDYSHFSLWDRN